MITELKTKSQVTIPNAIVSEMGLKIGDYFDISIENGKIVLTPVVMYPREYIEKLERELKSKKTKTYSTVKSLLSSLEEK